MRLSVIVMGLLLTLLTGPAWAQQSHMAIGGVDSRVPPLESQYLSQETGALAQQAARAAALLAVQKDDAAATEKALADVNAYWKAWCGERPGCGDAPAAVK